jgi:hypothetical protein
MMPELENISEHLLVNVIGVVDTKVVVFVVELVPK